MSIIFENETCCFISHENYLKSIYDSTHNNEYEIEAFEIKKALFTIKQPYKKTNKKDQTCSDKLIPIQKDVIHVQTKYTNFITKIRAFLPEQTICDSTNNLVALEAAEEIYPSCINCGEHSHGENSSNYPIVQKINDNFYIFPNNCKFYNSNVSELNRLLTGELFDLILLDPPWWNKYIRRKRKKSNDSYDMMYNIDIKKLPLSNLLTDNGVIVVWCTNSLQHLTAIDEFFDSWKVSKIARWYWLKVTVNGEPVCGYSTPPGKQPFEQIVIGSRMENGRLKESDGKVIVSVPSALHSHKPPLVEVLKPFVPENPKCLEIFARYLLPNWTSFGLEVIKFQHKCVYNKV